MSLFKRTGCSSRLRETQVWKAKWLCFALCSLAGHWRELGSCAHYPCDIKQKSLLPLGSSALLRFLLSLHFRYQAFPQRGFLCYSDVCPGHWTAQAALLHGKQLCCENHSFSMQHFCRKGHFSAAWQKESACRRVRPNYFSFDLRTTSQNTCIFWQEIPEKPLDSPAPLSAPTHGGMPGWAVTLCAWPHF